MSLFSEGEKTNPPDGTILAQTGILGDGQWPVMIVVAGTASTTLRFERRNIDNNGNVQSQLIKVPLNTTLSFRLGTVDHLAGEHLRVVTVGSPIGLVQATINDF